jgi:hypothetical protein
MRVSFSALIPCIATVLAAVPASANESLVVVPGSSAAIQVPAVAPYTSLGDTRLEMRVHSWRTPAATVTVFWNAGFKVTLRPTGELCASDEMDALPGYGSMMCADVNGKLDVSIRAQRDVKNMRFLYEVRGSGNDWTAATYCGSKGNGGSYLNTFPCPISTVNTRSWAGTGAIGDGAANLRLAWVKWHSSVVPAGSGGLAENTPADLADWRFEGSQASDGPGKATLGPLLFQPVAGATRGAIYMPTLVYPPACSAGASRTYRAGYPAVLDGSGSSPLDGGSVLKYSWREFSGPSAVAWTQQASAQPTVTGLVFGSYVFQLTVTDGGGRSSSCRVKDGAVASDNNGVVITNNPSVDALLGPMIRFGANPWPWFDDRHKAGADVQIKNLDSYYSAYWDIAAPGTVTVNAGSPTVTGAGTAFTSTFCQGSTPKSGAAIIVWYPAENGQTGRRQWSVASCQSDFQLTLTAPWKNDVSAGANLKYAYSDYNVSGAWAYNAAPANYYDNVAAYYALYYRSGIDDYQTAARKLADRFWTSPQIDRGAACVLDGPGTCFPARSQSTMGLILRALDGRPDMWSGFHKLMDTFMTFYLNRVDVSWGPGMWDLREEAYHLAMVSYCAMFDTDAAYRASCKASISQSFTNLWTPFKAADGSWPQLYYGYQYSSWDTGSMAMLTNGSTSVTGVGTSWNAGQFTGYPVWFTNTPSIKPPSNQAGDSTTYTATFVDPTHLVLDRPYQGTSGAHGWALGNSGSAGLVGWGSQPYMMGILSAAFDLAAKSIADSDPATSALAHNYNVTSANWIKNYGYWPLRKGLYYGAQFVNCQAPISDSNAFCTASNDTGSARVLSAEALRGVMTAYAYSGDSALKDFADTLYSAMFSKPGTGGPNPDGYYLDALNDGTGWYMTGAPPVGQAPKYFGLFFGFSSLSSWPAYRVGGAKAQTGATLAVDTNLKPGGRAARVSMTVTAPNGERSTALCEDSRCAVPFDNRQGAHMLKMEYLSASGEPLEVVERPLVEPEP